ncbi:MAG: hypothetical protein HY317_01825 [Acidobacteria bacterium]|nr:hypothetical protein [Acidobacteriota bacterium]
MTLIEIVAAVLLLLGSALVLGAVWSADRAEAPPEPAVAPSARVHEHLDRAA